ncbi:MAG: SDR family oxidoreductase [Candidatus Lambdaproteobacteria bacterium]|nr:SDR family oxidoreductase [Candidatus Lambdaproteobacteria bacterium]
MTQHPPEPRKPFYGMTDEELATVPTVYHPELFKGQVVMISGAAGGLGRGCAFLFARLGAALELCGRDGEKLERVAEKLRAFGNPVHCTPLTIRDPQQVADFIAGIWARHGRLDVQLNNAGGQFAQLALDFTVKGWQAVIDTNLNGTWYMMQQAALRWRDQGQVGNIINMVAVVERGNHGMAHTSAARAGVIHLSKTVAVEWAEHKIRVNCVAPGAVETPAFGQYSDAARPTLYRTNPMLRAGDLMDTAEACVYLAAPSGKFITGEVLHIDGGQNLWGDPWPAGKPDYFKFKD